MYLFYADDSGSPDDPNGQFFVLAGLSIFERQTHWLDQEISRIAQRFESYFGEGQCELHGSPMHSGRDGWKHAGTPAQRVQAVTDAIHLLNNKQYKHSRLLVFASVIEKNQMDKSEIIPTAFRDIAFAFDRSLRHMYQKYENAQRGMILFDKSSSERMIQDLSYTAKHIGRDNDKLRNFAEVPVFIDSKVSRLIQLADLIAYWIYRYYQSLDNRGFNMIEPHIWASDGEKLGLIEHISEETRAKLLTAHHHGYPFPSPSSHIQG